MMCPLGDETGYFSQAGSGDAADGKALPAEAATGAGGHGAAAKVSRGGGGRNFCRLKKCL